MKREAGYAGLSLLMTESRELKRGGKQAKMSSPFEPEIVVLYCQHSVDRNVNLANARRRLDGCKVRFAVMPCSSKVEIEYLVKLLEQGVDGIQVVGCPERLCHFLVGNTKAEKRVEYVRRLLKEIGFGIERVGMTRGQGLSADQLFEMARYRGQAVMDLGPNPMKTPSLPGAGPKAFQGARENDRK